TVAGYIDVGPAIVVIVEGGNAQRVVGRRLVDMRFRSDIGEFDATQIVVQNILLSRQTARSAHDGNTLPHAGCPFAGSGCRRKIEVDVVGYDQIKQAVAIIVD